MMSVNQEYMFVSYPHKSRKKVLEIVHYLQDHGYSLWIDDGITVGTNYHKMIAEKLVNSSAILLFLFDGMNESEYCKNEINLANNKHIPIIPISEPDFILSDELFLQIGMLEYAQYIDSSSMSFIINRIKQRDKVFKVLDKHNIWNKGKAWLEESKKSGRRFNSLKINERILPTANQTRKPDTTLPIYVNITKDDQVEDMIIIDKFINQTTGHLYLIGEGGMGKTTTMIHIMEDNYEGKEYDEDLYNNNLKQIPIFIELSKAPSNSDYIYTGNTSTFIRREFYRIVSNESSDTGLVPSAFKLDTIVNEVNQLFKTEKTNPEYILLLDGLNEVSRNEVGRYSILERIVDEIEWIIDNCPDARIVLTSRTIEDISVRSLKANIQTMYLQDLSKDTIKDYLISCNHDISSINQTLNNKELMECISNPLFLTLFASTEATKAITTRGQILKQYLNEKEDSYTSLTRIEEMADDHSEFVSVHKDQGTMTPETVCSILNYILPEVASYMVKKEIFYISKMQMKKIIEQFLDNQDDECINGEYGVELFEDNKSPELLEMFKTGKDVRDQILQIAVGVLGIMQETDNKYSFIHHYFRDYLAAVHFINHLRLANFIYEEDPSDKEIALLCLDEMNRDMINREVLTLIGEYLGEHLNRYHYDEESESYIKPDNHHNKDRLLLENTLDLYRKRFIENDYGVRNIIDILRYVRKELSGINLSYLDLSLSPIGTFANKYHEANVDCTGAKVNEYTFFTQSHTGTVNSAKFSKDGRYVVTASDDNTAKIWNVENGKCIYTLDEHNDRVNYAEFSNDGRYVVTASNDDNAKIWDVESGKCIYTLDEHKSWVYYTEFSNNGKYVVTASWDNTAKIWDVDSGKCIHTLNGHNDWIDHANFSNDERYVVTRSNDGIAKIWDVDSGRCIHNLDGHNNRVNYAEFSHDGKYVVTASNDHTAKIWNVDSGRCIHTLDEHKYSVNYAEFSHDGRYVVTTSWDHTAKIWSVEFGRCIHTLDEHKNSVNYAEFSHDGKYVVTASNDHTAKIWNVESGICIHTLDEHNSWINWAEFSLDSKYVVTASKDNTTKIWNVESGKCIHTFGEYDAAINYTKFSNDEKYVVTASEDNTAKIWDVESRNYIHTLDGHKGSVKHTEFSNDGKYIVTASWDHTAKIWDVESGRCIHTLDEHRNCVEHAEFSLDRKYVVTASDDHTAKIWDVESGCCIHTLDEHNSWINWAEFSLDGKYVVTASKDRTTKIWDVESGRCIHTLDEHKYSVNYVKFSLDGKYVVTASDDHTAKIWDVESGKCIYTLDGHYDWVYVAKFSNDGKYVVTTSKDGTAKIWDVDTGRCIHTLLNRCKHYAKFSNDGKYVVTASNDRTAKIWDVKSGRCIHTLKYHQGIVNYAEFSSDGKYVVIASDDSTARVWKTETGSCIHVLYNVPKLYVQNLNLNNLHTASNLSDDRLELLKMYGANVGK